MQNTIKTCQNYLDIPGWLGKARKFSHCLLNLRSGQMRWLGNAFHVCLMHDFRFKCLEIQSGS